MSVTVRPWRDGDDVAVDALLDADADALWAGQGHRLHGPDRDGSRWRRSVVAVSADRVVGAGTVARNQVHPGRYSAAVEVSATWRRRGVGTELLRVVHRLRPRPLPLTGKVRERDAAALGFARANGAATYQRCPCPVVDPVAAAAALVVGGADPMAARPLLGTDHAVLATAFADCYRWVHQRWSPVGDESALFDVATATVAEADLTLSHGCWRDGALAAVAFAFTEHDRLEVVAETMMRAQPSGRAALAACVAATLQDAGAYGIAEVEFDGHDDDPHLAPLITSLPTLRTDPLLLIELP